MLSNFKIYSLLGIVITTLFFLASCKNDDDFDPSSDLNGTTSDIRAMLRSEDITQRATIPSDNFFFVSEAGAVVTAAPNSFVSSDGTIYNGNIDFEFSEMYTKSAILRYGIQTLTLDEQILESDGEFHIQAFENSNRLTLANDRRLNLRVPNEDPNDLMELFNGVELWWAPDPNSELTTIEDSLGFVVYEALLDDMGWVNIDYFTKFDNVLTDVTVELEEGYTARNTNVFAIFKDRDIVLSMYNFNTENFNTMLPVGESVYFVAIAAAEDDSFRYAEKREDIETGLIVNLDPRQKSIDDLKDCLEDLD